MKKYNSKALLPMIVAAREGSPEQRLAAITACFLVEKFPAGFRYQMGGWGAGRETLGDLLTRDMKGIKNTCNTAGCIAGLSNFLFESAISPFGPNGAANRLGLSVMSEPRKIFIPDVPPSSGWQDGYEELDHHPIQVGRVLTHFMRTGKIDWSVTRRTTPVRVAGVWF